jgi:hypothetical protein
MPIAIAAVVSTAGCLQLETSNTLYLSPDGAVAWAVSESNVYSDDNDAGKRTQEERQYLGAALLGNHDTARALVALHPLGPVRTTIVRDGRPFHVITDAGFDRIDRMLEQLLTKAGIQTTASLVSTGDRTTLRVRLDFGREVEADDVVSGLLDVDHLRFLLTEGRFVDAIGFDVNGGSAAFAREWLAAADEACEEKRPIEFALSWAR